MRTADGGVLTASVGDAELVSHPVEADPAVVSLSLINGFDLRTSAGSIDLQQAGQRLVALLGFHERPVTRAFIAGTLWPESDDEHAAARLRTSLWRIGECAAWLQVTPSHLRLQDNVLVDVRELSRCARRIIAGDAGLIEIELERFEFDVLPDWYDDWVVVEQERFRQLRLHALESLSEHLVGAGRPAQAILAGLAAVRAEPLRESAQRALVRAHLAEGNAVEAIRSYQGYRQLLSRELGMSPSPVMENLVRGLLPAALTL